LYSIGLAPDPLQIQKDGSLGGFGLECMVVDGAEVYISFSESSPCTDEH